MHLSALMISVPVLSAACHQIARSLSRLGMIHFHRFAAQDMGFAHTQISDISDTPDAIPGLALTNCKIMSFGRFLTFWKTHILVRQCRTIDNHINFLIFFVGQNRTIL